MVELRQFEALVAVADERHLGRAATRLGIAASSLSERLSRLERSTGLKLVERSTKRVGLTTAGAGVLDAARAVVDAWLAARGRMAEVKGQRAGVVRIAVVNEAGTCAREVAAAVEQRLPGFTVETTAMSSREAKRALYYREIEASIIAGLPHPPNCRWNQAERPTRARFVGRPRVRDLVLQWRASWSGSAAVTFAEIAHRRERDAIRAAHPRVDPWLLAQEFLRGPAAAAPSREPGLPPFGASDGGQSGLDGGAGAGSLGERVEEADALEIDFDERGCVPLRACPPPAGSRSPP